MRLVLALVAVAAGVLLARAEAQPSNNGCYPTIEDALHFVADKYEERPHLMFRSYFNSLIVLMTANLKTGTWTMFTERSNGFCMINVGDSFGEPSDKLKAMGTPGSDL